MSDPISVLFPGINPIDPLSTRQLNRAIHAAADAAGIDKRVSMHTLRHSFATHLLEAKGQKDNACKHDVFLVVGKDICLNDGEQKKG